MSFEDGDFANNNDEKEEADVISFDALGNILHDFTIEEFDHCEVSILVTPTMREVFEDLEGAIQRNRMYKSLLQGPSGVGKTTTLLYIGHVARVKGYVVFPLQAGHFVNQSYPMSTLIKEFLMSWMETVEDSLLKDIFGADLDSTKEIIQTIFWKQEEEKKIINIFQQLVAALKTHRKNPVIFLIDQCNEFHVKKQVMKMYSDSDFEIVGPEMNPVGAMFLDWNMFSVHRGGIFYGSSSGFQSMPDARDGNAALFLKIKPMNHDAFKGFVDFMVKQNHLPEECASTHFDDFFELCGGIPREARHFGTEKKGLRGKNCENYNKWKAAYMDARIPFFKTRIQRLLNKEKIDSLLLQGSVTFASRLFVGEKIHSAPPDVWTASCLLVREDGFCKLFCPAAGKAIFSVFDNDSSTCEAIEIIRRDPSIKWRSLEFAFVYIFRRSQGFGTELFYTDLYGDNQDSLVIKAALIQHGGAISPSPNSIPRNTLFVCFPNTPGMVEFFIHDATGLQILVQVSELPYHEHEANYHPKSHDVQVYQAAAKDPIGNAPLQYIYLTPNSSLMSKKRKRDQPDVMLVAAENMKRLFGNLFDSF